MKEHVVNMAKIGNNQKIVAGKFKRKDRESNTHYDE
jgi:hypothetical protein